MALSKVGKKLAAFGSGRHPELKVTSVSGAAADTNIAVAGIKREDAIVEVLWFEDLAVASGAVLKPRTGVASITSDGNIQLTLDNTTGDTLAVIWYDIRP